MTGKLAKERAAAHRARRNKNRAVERETELRNRLKLVSVQRDEILDVLERIIENDGAEGSKCFNAMKLYAARVDARTVIAAVKGGAA